MWCCLLEYSVVQTSWVPLCISIFFPEAFNLFVLLMMAFFVVVAVIFLVLLLS